MRSSACPSPERSGRLSPSARACWVRCSPCSAGRPSPIGRRTSAMQIGIDSFVAAYDDASLAVAPATRLRNTLEQIALADQLGLDSFGIGEHHRKEYLDSAPPVIL